MTPSDLAIYEYEGVMNLLMYKHTYMLALLHVSLAYNITRRHKQIQNKYI